MQCKLQLKPWLQTLLILLWIELAVLWFRSRRLDLKTVSRRTNVSSRSHLEKNCQRLGLGHYVSCPRPFFGQIVQATLIKHTQCERASDAGVSEALTFSYKISALSKSCYYHIRELRCLRPYLDFKTASTIATFIVHSKLDYCNPLYIIFHTLR